MPLHVPTVGQALTAALVWAYATRKLTNLDDTRAALIDALGTPANFMADLSTLEGRVTAVRAALIDNLLSVEATGTIAHPDGTTEQDSLEITPTELTEYAIVLLDMNALTQGITIRVYIKIDDTNYRLINRLSFPSEFPTGAKGVPIQLYPMSVDWKITLQSGVAEGASRNIPYRYVRRSLV